MRGRKFRAAAIGLLAPLAVAAVWVSRPLSAPLTEEVHLERLTWVEVRELIDHGKTVAIVPTGGTEQNGPHMILGKHNYVVHYAADRIARELGNALVAPVISYVPEGDPDPPTGHMTFPGTLSVPEPVFEAVLEAATRSLKAHGFTVVAFLGDSAWNQEPQARVAERLTAEWRGDGVRVVHVDRYYADNGQTDWLREQGETDADIGNHAGIRDTSELLAVHPGGVRTDRMAASGTLGYLKTGVHGDPTRASAERGERLLRLKIDAAVAQLKETLGGAGS